MLSITAKVISRQSPLILICRCIRMQLNPYTYGLKQAQAYEICVDQKATFKKMFDSKF